MSAKEGSLEHQPVILDWENPDFTDEKLLDDELEGSSTSVMDEDASIYESFPKLFDLIDESKTVKPDSVSSKDFKDVVDACTLCDMCFLTKCPHVPPQNLI